ncbi:Immunoglobulin heavy variable 3-74, partial [Galemys pyrenaicus]
YVLKFCDDPQIPQGALGSSCRTQSEPAVSQGPCNTDEDTHHRAWAERVAPHSPSRVYSLRRGGLWMMGKEEEQLPRALSWWAVFVFAGFRAEQHWGRLGAACGLCQVSCTASGSTLSNDKMNWIHQAPGSVSRFGHDGGSKSPPGSTKGLFTMGRDKAQKSLYLQRNSLKTPRHDRVKLRVRHSEGTIALVESGGDLVQLEGSVIPPAEPRDSLEAWHYTLLRDTKSRDKAQNALYLQRNSLKPHDMSEYDCVQNAVQLVESWGDLLQPSGSFNNPEHPEDLLLHSTDPTKGLVTRCRDKAQSSVYLQMNSQKPQSMSEYYCVRDTVRGQRVSPDTNCRHRLERWVFIVACSAPRFRARGRDCLSAPDSPLASISSMWEGSFPGWALAALSHLVPHGNEWGLFPSILRSGDIFRVKPEMKGPLQGPCLRIAETWVKISLISLGIPIYSPSPYHQCTITSGPHAPTSHNTPRSSCFQCPQRVRFQALGSLICEQNESPPPWGSQELGEWELRREEQGPWLLPAAHGTMDAQCSSLCLLDWVWATSGALHCDSHTGDSTPPATQFQCWHQQQSLRSLPGAVPTSATILALETVFKQVPQSPNPEPVPAPPTLTKPGPASSAVP